MSTNSASPWRTKVSEIIQAVQTDAQELVRTSGAPIYLVEYGKDPDGWSMVCAIAGTTPFKPEPGSEVRILGRWDGSSPRNLGAWVYDTLWVSPILPEGGPNA